jgi:hypothetical protein
VAVVLLAGCAPAPKPPDDGTSPLVVIQMVDGSLPPGSREVLPRFVLFGDRTAIVPAGRLRGRIAEFAATAPTLGEPPDPTLRGRRR